MMQKAIHLVQRDASIWASLFLLCLFAIGAKTGITFDLLFVAISGFYLCARWQIRGCCYALALLCVDAVGRHALFVTDHMFQLGIEGSLACTFFVTALAFEQGSGLVDSLTSQIQSRETALDNLEEDFSKAQQESLTQQVAFQERIALLQKELEELQTEHSSILILNEVLRKTTARHGQENTVLSSKVLDADRHIAQIKSEYEECKKDLARLKDSDKLAIANTELMQELNQARYDKAQTHLINETLARLYLKENLKAKDADSEASALTEQLNFARKESARVQSQMEEIERLKSQIEEMRKETSLLAEQLANVPKEQTAHLVQEIDRLQHQAQKAEQMRALTKAVEQDPDLAEQLNAAHEHISRLLQIEPQLRQLRQQFDEKNQVLHQVRSELFQTETELQKLRMEKAALELHPVPKEVEKELEDLTAELMALEEENKELQELITVLNDSKSLKSEKKK